LVILNIFTNLLVMIKLLKFVILNLRLLLWNLILLVIFEFLILRINLSVLIIHWLKLHLSIFIFISIINSILAVKRTSLKLVSITLKIIVFLLFILMIIEVISIWRADVIINGRDGLSLPSLNIVQTIFVFSVLLGSLQSSGSCCWSGLHPSSLFFFVGCCILLRVTFIFRKLIHLQIFAAVLTAFLSLQIVLLIFLELRVIFELVEVWDLSVVVGDDGRGGIV
jgi:hypothetical protein